MATKYVMPHQAQFMQAPFLFPECRFHFMVCGYGAGKTSTLATMAEFLLVALHGKRDYEGRNPRVIIAGVNIGHLLKTTVAYIIRDLENAGIPFKFNKKDNVITVGDVDFILMSISEPERIVGVDCVAVLCDELDDANNNTRGDDLAVEALKALNERCRQAVKGFREPFLAACSTSQGQRGLYRIYCSFKKSGMAFTLLRGRTQDNLFQEWKSPGYSRNMERFYSPMEKRVYMDGEFLSISTDRIFPDFDWDKNFAPVAMDREITDRDVLYISMDFNTGYNRACVFTVRNGIIYGVKSYDFPSAREMPIVLRHDFPRNSIYFIPDATSNKEVMTFFRELRKYDIKFIMKSKNPSKEDSVFSVNKLLYLRRLIYTEAAKDAAEAIAGFMYGKNREIPKGVRPSDLAHMVDSTRYTVVFLLLNRPEFRDVRSLTLDRHLQQEADREAVVELEGGYVEIDPAG